MNAISPVRGKRQAPMASASPVTVLYIRFSTTGQMDGISEDRQREYAQAYAEKHGLTIDREYFDQGASAFHETHMKGEFGRMLADIESGAIPPGSTLLVESLDRLSRADTIMASNRFTSLLVAGLTVVTTIDGKAYNRFSEGIIGDFFGATGHQVGNHQASRDKSARMAKSHKARRGTPSAAHPSWFIKLRDVQTVTTVSKGKTTNRTQAVTTGVTVDEAKKGTVRRAGCDLLLRMGFDSTAQVFNREGVPTLTDRTLGRSEKVWDAAMVRNLFVDRRVLGEQTVCRWVHGKREKTGEVIKNAYEAIMTEAEYFRLHQAIEARSKGVSAADARKTGQMTNLFGNLGRCAKCGNRMTVQTRGRGTHLYYVCTMGRVGTCEAKQYHRLDNIERSFLGFFGEAILGSQERIPDDPAAALLANHEAARMEAEELADLYKAAYRKSLKAKPGSLEHNAYLDIEAEHQAAIAKVKKLESTINAKRAEKPAGDVFKALRMLITRLTTEQNRPDYAAPRLGDGTPIKPLTEAERIEVRTKIAGSLPSIVKAVTFEADGTYAVTIVDDLPLMPATRATQVVNAWQKIGDRYVIQPDGQFVARDKLGRIRHPSQVKGAATFTRPITPD